MGVVLSLINEGYPPETKFTPANIPDLTGKVMIVTGANSGAYILYNYYPLTVGLALTLFGYVLGVGKETAKVCHPLS